jgi:hypothetical protein
MQKWIIPTLVTISLATTFFAVKFGLKPRAIAIIQPSNFESSEEMAQYLRSQLFQKLHQTKTLVIGLDKNHPEFFDKTILALQSRMKETDSQWNPQIVTMDLKDSFSKQPSEELRKLLANDRETAIILNFISLPSQATPGEPSGDCEMQKDLDLWLTCLKNQKLKQMANARKVDFKKPVGALDQESQFNYVVFYKD